MDDVLTSIKDWLAGKAYFKHVAYGVLTFASLHFLRVYNSSAVHVASRIVHYVEDGYPLNSREVGVFGVLTLIASAAHHYRK
jgi:hypothetical protein